MIIREFAVDPAIFDDPDSLRGLLHVFGPEHGRYLTGLPESMLNELWSQIGDLGGVGQQIATEFLTLVQHSRLTGDEGPWSDAVAAADAALPYHGFLSGRRFASEQFERRRIEPGSPHASSVFEANTDEVERTPEAMAEAIRPLLQTASLIKIVDPYFKIDDHRFMSVLEEFIRVAASTPYRRPGSTKFEVHTALKGGSDDTFTNVANWQGRALKKAIDRFPGLSAVRFFAWNKDGWHDRYVLAKDAGLRFSVGLDKQIIDSQQSRTAVNHLKTREIGKYWKQYDERSARRGDLLGEIKLVS